MSDKKSLHAALNKQTKHIFEKMRKSSGRVITIDVIKKEIKKRLSTSSKDQTPRPTLPTERKKKSFRTKKMKCL